MSLFIPTLVFTLATAGLPAPAYHAVDNASWIPEAGDSMLVDTKENMGYLVHSDGAYYTFPVATGQRRVVRYIGRTYNATTPERNWVVQSEQTKGDRVTFGPRGLFLRLFVDGESTPYGIHGHRDSAKMIADPSEERFRSMGCIIVDEEILTIIEKTFTLNGGSLSVQTHYGDPLTVLLAQGV